MTATDLIPAVSEFLAIERPLLVGDRWEGAASGRTFDGPEPNRPSLGISSAGSVTLIGSSTITRGYARVFDGPPRESRAAGSSASKRTSLSMSLAQSPRCRAATPPRATTGA